VAAHAQQPTRMRRIGALLNLAADDPESVARITSFVQGLQDLGWTARRNVQIDYRWAAGDPLRFRRYADELIALSPDVVLASATPSVIALQQATRAIPIVFTGVADPVGAGLVDSLARPGGNATGFTVFEFGTTGKWLELLKEIAPHVSHVAVVREHDLTSGIGQFAAIQSVASAMGVELVPVGLRDGAEIERGITAFAKRPNGGLIVTGSPLTGLHRDLIISLVARHRLPAVFPFRYFAASGGLISYGADLVDQHRRAATYIDRILRGEKATDLPVQMPVKYELVINLKTAKALGLDIPATVLARADEVIE
jgi:putative ABC transport system substrate-binding protein